MDVSQEDNNKDLRSIARRSFVMLDVSFTRLLRLPLRRRRIRGLRIYHHILLD